jgi:hypothetical protein
MRRLFFAALLLLPYPAVHAAPARLAPEFTFLGAGDKARSLKSLRGQSVVLLISDSPGRGAFKKQLKYLEEIYQQFASKGVVIIAAVPDTEKPLPSNIPVARATNAAAVTGAYGVEKGFQIAIIGSDGNLDYQTGKVLAPERVRDVIQNSFAVQANERKTN